THRLFLFVWLVLRAPHSGELQRARRDVDRRRLPRIPHKLAVCSRIKSGKLLLEKRAPRWRMDGLERAALPELHASVHAAMLIVPTRGPVQLWFARVECGLKATQKAYEVESTTLVSELKAQIENQEFVPADMIRLLNGDEELVDGTLAGNGVEEDEELDLMLGVLGGMRAKWKKKRMRRLRRKRRKMRQRAR
ncbi:hypothetical protein THAOC_05027, partial [Thalassiosira oceanica]